ncbi:pstII restriction-modification enzyme Res subunit domain protein [Escherichia coli DEC6B]|nr:pstII restriction-modification enzyme Res subunit domain protein [Escherichia coli DEC6B]
MLAPNLTIYEKLKMDFYPVRQNTFFRVSLNWRKRRQY